MSRIETFRARLGGGAAVGGTFLKTPSRIVCEVLGATPLDVVCLDSEHAPFDRMALDGCVAALRAADMPSLVRLPSAAPEHILNALDIGATGIVAPHVRSAGEARAIVAASRYGRGGGADAMRGYAGSSRAAGYATRTLAANLANAEATTVVLQIEDLEAVRDIEAIAAVEGVDALFIGRIDLTVALGAASPFEASVVEACQRVVDAARQVGRAVGLFTPDIKELPAWRDRGAAFFLLGSDHGFLQAGARALAADLAV